ncbi:serine hydrolase domain-containing protein [Nonlabens agnitus]|uniref:Peptidase n=1 Tax=Nonlabens agnitus TaxID=870484 RepID=A0A2S9WR19_9FLAO|nr:serine hydrolase domain-containing protein [Nonlabens agnitus]PRP65911.1 peptidase [Nonlabens agnitus]
MTKAILTTILFLTLSQLGFSQTNFDKAKLDSYFQALEQNDKFMGSVAVSKDGEMLYTKSIGYADVENNVEATEETKYRIGSITKTFTAVLVMKAVEEKMLNLSQTINKWFPSIANSSKITLEHLLGHRSGIHNFTDDEEYLTYNTQSKTEQELVGIITNGGSDFEPDSKAEYSNSNFVLLSYILEKTFEKPYSELVQEHIVEPIGLTDTYVFRNLDIANNEAKSYKFLNTWKVEPETDASIPLGAGAITSTPIDLTRFADALFTGKLVTPESLEIMKIIKDVYGKGLFQFPFYENIGYGHTGGIDGFSSVYTYFPESKVSYALTSNGTHINNNDISVAVLNAMYNKPYEIPSFKSYSLTTEDLDPYLGVYASSQIPIKITITKEGATLIAQGTGQPAFPLEATEKDTFKFDQAGAKFEFNPSENAMILFQGGGQILFSKE